MFKVGFSQGVVAQLFSVGFAKVFTLVALPLFYGGQEATQGWFGFKVFGERPFCKGLGCRINLLVAFDARVARAPAYCDSHGQKGHAEVAEEFKGLLLVLGGGELCFVGSKVFDDPLVVEYNSCPSGLWACRLEGQC